MHSSLLDIWPCSCKQTVSLRFPITVIPRYSVPRNSDFPRYSDFMLLTNFLSTESNIPRNSDFPQNSDFLLADGRSHYIEERMYCLNPWSRFFPISNSQRDAFSIFFLCVFYREFPVQRILNGLFFCSAVLFGLHIWYSNVACVLGLYGLRIEKSPLHMHTLKKTSSSIKNGLKVTGFS